MLPEVGIYPGKKTPFAGLWTRNGGGGAFAPGLAYTHELDGTSTGAVANKNKKKNRTILKNSKGDIAEKIYPSSRSLKISEKANFTGSLKKF